MLEFRFPNFPPFKRPFLLHPILKLRAIHTAAPCISPCIYLTTSTKPDPLPPPLSPLSPAHINGETRQSLHPRGARCKYTPRCVRPREKFSRAIRNFLPHPTSLPCFKPIPLICITFDQSRAIIIRGRGGSSAVDAAKASEKKSNLSFGGTRLQSVFQRDIRPATGPYVERRERSTCAPLSTWRCIRLADFSRAKHRARRTLVHAGRFSSYQGMFGELEDGRRGRRGYHRGAKSLAYAFCTLKSRHARPTLNWNPAPPLFPSKVDSPSSWPSSA